MAEQLNDESLADWSRSRGEMVQQYQEELLKDCVFTGPTFLDQEIKRVFNFTAKTTDQPPITVEYLKSMRGELRKN